MPASKPDATMVLDAAIDYLERELLPTLSGYHRFQSRVTVNALAQIRRELELAATQAQAEAGRLAALLDYPAGHPGGRDELSRELAARIRAGEIALDDPALVDHLRQSLVEALRINNPKWIGEAGEHERG